MTTHRRGGRRGALLLLPLFLSLFAPTTPAASVEVDRLDGFGSAVDHGTPPASPHSRLVGLAAHGGGGYWVGTSDGSVYSYGGAPFHGSAGNIALRSPIVGMAARPDGNGYWLAAADGGVFSYGAATFHGSLGATPLRSPIVGIASSRSGEGYWMVAADGGIFSFGDARFAGSLGDRSLNAPIVGMAAAPGGGYWMVAADGGIFTFGGARFHGSAGDLQLRHPVVSMAAVPDGSGYWLAGADGGVFSYGTARFLGAGSPSSEPVTTITSRGAEGYWLLRSPPRPGSGRRSPALGLTVYSGLGTWVDVYDWSETFNRYAEQRVGVADVDRMAEVGVQTLYIQTSRWDSPTPVLEPERLLPLIQRAKQRGIAVVAWYLPTFEDPQRDMHRLVEAARIPGVDALAVDIESLKVKDVDERNRRLIEISRNLRAALPDVALGAIPYPPVVTDVINPNLWPRFPWAELGPLYDIWLPMSYQSHRKADSGYRDGYRYTAENIDRMRAHLGSEVPVHTIGGIADRTSPHDVAAIIRAASERRVLGGSLYDWRTTAPDLWPHLQPLRDPAR